MSTYIPLETITLTSGATSVTFGEIPPTYTDLIVVSSINSNRGANLDSVAFRFNNDSGTNYGYTGIFGDTSQGATGTRAFTQNALWVGNVTASSTSNNFGTCVSQIYNYTNPNIQKSVLTRNGAIAGVTGTYTIAGTWRSLSAITSVTVLSETGNSFNAGSTFTIYGVSSGTLKAIGGEVTVSGGFAYHTFRQSGLFIPTENISAEVLVIAGGGAAAQRGSNRTAGGGAGGLVYNSTTFNAINYSVLVGAGATAGTNGNNSSISTFNAIGGGMGGIAAGGAGSNGGSGGGGSNNGSGTGGGGQRFGGNPTSGQGFKGGDTENQTVIVGGWASGAGGGGAGGAGGNATGNGGQFTNNLGGVGGIGSASYNTWALATNTGELVSGLRYYAGGGGGGGITSTGTENFASGGAGGGAAASSGNSFGLANTGGGGGAGVLDSQGGSGVVIVRYAV